MADKTVLSLSPEELGGMNRKISLHEGEVVYYRKKKLVNVRKLFNLEWLKIFKLIQ